MTRKEDFELLAKLFEDYGNMQLTSKSKKRS